MAMGVLGIGVDIVHTPRIASIFTRRSPQRLAARILSREELTHWETLPTSDLSRAHFLAVRYAYAYVWLDRSY
jgi:holo-[acyl-carrier protein] synthase